MSMKLLLACAVLLLHLSAQAQTRHLATLEEAKRVADGIVASVAASNYSGAIKELRPLSVIPTSDFDLFEAQFNSQQGNMLRQFGEPSGYEFVRQDQFGSRMARLQFAVFHEKSALRWNFVFYKASKGWVISHFAFDGNAMAFFPGGGSQADHPK